MKLKSAFKIYKKLRNCDLNNKIHVQHCDSIVKSLLQLPHEYDDYYTLDNGIQLNIIEFYIQYKTFYIQLTIDYKDTLYSIEYKYNDELVCNYIYKGKSDKIVNEGDKFQYDNISIDELLNIINKI